MDKNQQQALILTAAQAQAVYSAMCALDNVRGRLDIVMRDVRVKEYANAVILITSKGMSEDHSNQAAFAAAYGLPVAPPDLAAALRVAYSDIQRLPGHTIDMLGRIEAALELSPA